MIPLPLPYPRCSKRSNSSSDLVLYSLLLVAHLSLVWLLPFFPTQDGPSHLYNLVILHDLLNGGVEWGKYYSCQLLAVPNLGFHMIAYPLLSLFSPEATERVFLSIYIVLMGISVPFYLRTFGKTVFPYAYLVVPLLFNFTLMMGFYSYSIAIPLYLIAFSCCFSLRSHSIMTRFFFYNLAGVVIYFMHLVAFGIFVVSLASMVLAEVAGLRRKLTNLLKLAALMFPVILNMLIYLHNNSETFTNSSSQIMYTSWQEKLLDFLMFSSVNLSPWQAVAGYVLLVIVLTLFTFGPRGVNEDLKLELSSHDGNASSKSCLLYLEAVLVMLYLFAPFRWGETSYFNQRFPWVILLLALPLMHVPPRLFSVQTMSRLVVFTALLFLGVNSIVLFQKSTLIESFVEGLSLDFPKGALVMAYKKPRDYFRTDVLIHAVSHYGLRKGVVNIGNYEAQFRMFPVHFKTLPSIPSCNQALYETEAIDWAQFPGIRYIFAWEQNTSSLGRIIEFYVKIFDNGRLAVWRRK